MVLPGQDDAKVPFSAGREPVPKQAPSGGRTFVFVLLGSLVFHVGVVAVLHGFDVVSLLNQEHFVEPSAVDLVSESEAREENGKKGSSGGTPGGSGQEDAKGGQKDGQGSGGKAQEQAAQEEAAKEQAAKAEAQRAAEQKAQEQKLAEQKAQEEKAQAQRAEEQKAQEEKAQAQKAEEAKAQAAKQQEAKAQDTKPDEKAKEPPKPSAAEAKAQAREAKAQEAAAKAEAKAQEAAAKAEAKAEARREAASKAAAQKEARAQPPEPVKPEPHQTQTPEEVRHALEQAMILPPQSEQMQQIPLQREPPPSFYAPQDRLALAIPAPLPTDDASAEGMSYKLIVFAMIDRAKIYPKSAKERQARGHVVLAFSIDATGHPINITLLRSSGESDLDAAALTMVGDAAPYPVPPEGAQRDFAIDVGFGTP